MNNNKITIFVNNNYNIMKKKKKKFLLILERLKHNMILIMATMTRQK